MPAPKSRCTSPPDLQRLTRDELPVATVELARFLIGCVLVRCDGDELMTGRIVETEAYEIGDPSSHARSGPTKRNRSMFARHAHAYIYLIYGTSYCLNISTEAEGEGAAVLVRAIEPLDGIETMRRNRGRAVRDYEVARGPGNLCRALAIGPALDGADLDVDGRLWVAAGAEPASEAIGASVRIGITRAVEREHRFYLRGSRAVSGPRALSP